MRKLATIEKISELLPIAGADRIEVAKVRGWMTVVKKGEFSVGDTCVFFEIDSLLPRADWNLFLQKDKGTSPVRLKTVKLKGQISQGLALPISTFPNLMKPFHDGDGVIREFVEGDDVSEILGVTKYEIPEAGGNNSPPKGSFPHFCRKSDEERCVDGSTLIVTNEGEYKISEIVNKKMMCKVLSFNVETKKDEYKQVLNFSKSSDDKSWVSIELDSGVSLSVTEDHLVYLPDLCCYRQAKFLRSGDTVKLIEK